MIGKRTRAWLERKNGEGVRGSRVRHKSKNTDREANWATYRRNGRRDKDRPAKTKGPEKRPLLKRLLHTARVGVPGKDHKYKIPKKILKKDDKL